MANTGYKITLKLKRVTNDVNEYPLDVNNQLCSETGLPQATIDMPTDDDRYRVMDTTSCPIEGSFTASRTSDFQRDNCEDEEVGTIISFTKTYTSTISQEDADNQASTDGTFTTEGQAFANTVGDCNPPLPSDAIGIVVVDLYQEIDACGYIESIGTIPHQIPVYRGNNFLPNDGTPAKNCWALASDLATGSSLDYRFEFNVARLINTYPDKTEFVFKIRGRGATAGSLNGVYSLKGADNGNMKMDGSPGSYIPTVEMASDLGVLPYSGKAYGGGADGNIGLDYGTDILTFTYNVASKTLSLA